jgi:ribosomal protein S18 acetylase RimI-like enzyme
MEIRHTRESDHAFIVSVVNDWWGGRPMAGLLPRLFFAHFQDTSFVVEAGGQVVAFLVGFVSQSRPGEAYIHFVGIHPAQRGQGLGAQLYGLFFDAARARGCDTVRCITSPVNTGSIAFHTRMGFAIEHGDGEQNGVPVARDYDGPGHDRVCFVKRLTM